jgi:cobyrinic acid a,c-diamide synthase
VKIPRLVLAAPSSNSGKTLVTCGILQALVDRGLDVASFKCGPDYIDPMFHSRVIGAKSLNLDPFFTDRDTMRYLFGRTAEDADISVIEGVMGFYDGTEAAEAVCSTHDVSRRIDAPVVLVVNCRGASLSIVPVVKGFVEFEPNNIRGVILNNLPASLYPKIKERIESDTDVEVVGYVPNVKDLVLESRHLGLVLPSEIDGLKDKLHRLARVLEETLDIDALLRIAGDAPDYEYLAQEHGWAGHARVALADDEAFCFIYADNIRLLEETGAEIVRFSPLHDSKVPEADGLILYGGYPELHAEELSSNKSMLEDIRSKIASGMPCMAECGGFMYLHETMEDASGMSYPMVGAVPGRTYNSKHLARFGYITVTAGKDMMVLQSGDSVKAHEFHYWDSENCGSDCEAAKVSGRKYMCEHGTGTLMAGFPHLYYYSNPIVPMKFLESCIEYASERR